MTIYAVTGVSPQIARDVFVAPDAFVVGRVTLAEGASIWFGAIVRGDGESISVGPRTNIQDGAILHADPGYPLCIGADATIGHGAVVHGCTIGDGTLIGIGAVVMNGAVLGRHCLVAAGALVSERKVFPDRCLVLGSPARQVRALSDDEVAGLMENARIYTRRAADYRLTLRRSVRSGGSGADAESQTVTGSK
jgi:carbonic anhydrase/acetyltransferase-like protein (isoleucine patch superfamily)